MLIVDDKNRVVRIVSPELFKEEPILMFSVIEKAALTSYRLDGITWDGIFKNIKLVSQVSRDKIKKIIRNIFDNGNPNYGIMLLTNSGLLRRLLDEGGHIENPNAKELDSEEISTIGDYYYYLSKGNTDTYRALFGSSIKIINYIDALNYIFNACEKTPKIRFNYNLAKNLLKEAKKISPDIINSGFLYPELIQTIKYFEI